MTVVADRRRLRRIGAPLALVLVIGSGGAVFAQGGRDQPPTVVGEALQRLSAGDIAGVVPLFRYFDDVIGAAEASKDRMAIRVFFELLEQEFGLPVSFEPIVSTTRTYVNVQIESADADAWRNSTCAFKTYAYRTTFVRTMLRRPAEVLLESCLDSQLRPTAIRKIDIHFVNPDRETVQHASSFLDRFRKEIERIQGPRA